MTEAHKPLNDMRHSVWLCPSLTHARLLTASIEDLSQVSGADVFAPHVTVLGDLNCDPSQTWDALCALRLSGPFEAQVTGVGQTDAYFMALFLDLDVPPSLMSLRAGTARRIGVAPATYRPHLSLAYGDAVDLRDTKLARRVEIKFADMKILFDRLCVVRSASDIPIADWEVTYSLTL